MRFSTLTILGAMLLVNLQVSAQDNSQLEDIKAKIANSSYGEPLKPSDLKGAYAGDCYDNLTASKEAVYFDSFINAGGASVNLAISTLQTYDGDSLPAQLAFLLIPNQVSWEYFKNFAREGLSGTDNNMGLVGEGAGFKYLYTSFHTDTTFEVSVSYQYPQCKPNEICNPPVLAGCGYTNNPRGGWNYQGCLRKNDRTVFKKDKDGSLISHRTADGVGEPTNNLSFYLQPVSKFCRWRK